MSMQNSYMMTHHGKSRLLLPKIKIGFFRSCILICETFQMTYCLVVYAVPNRSYAITGSIFSRNAIIQFISFIVWVVSSHKNSLDKMSLDKMPLDQKLINLIILHSFC